MTARLRNHEYVVGSPTAGCDDATDSRPAADGGRHVAFPPGPNPVPSHRGPVRWSGSMRRGGLPQLVPARGRAGRGVRSVLCVVLLVGITLLLGSCGAYSLKLRGWNDEGRFEDAREGGAAWLERHADEVDTSEWRSVYYEQARADLGEARVVDTAQAYAEFRARHASSPHVGDLLSEARSLHAAAEYRDAVVPSRDVAVYRRFRDAFAGTEAAGRALVDESRVAFDAAMADPSVANWRRFRADYDGVPEASVLLGRALRLEAELELEGTSWLGGVEDYQRFSARYEAFEELADLLSRARRQEAEAAFAVARQTHTVTTYAAFQVAYGAFSEAESLLVQARELEASLAFDAALAVGTLDALDAFRAAHLDTPWGDRAAQAMGQLALAPLDQHLGGAGAFDHTDADGVQRFAFDYGAELAVARPPEELVRRHAERANTAPLWRAYLTLYPESPVAERVRARLADLLWAETTTADVRTYSRFIGYFPNDSRSPRAVRIVTTVNEIYRTRRRGYQIAVQRVVAGQHDAQLTFTVRDCANNPVVGLRASSLRVLDGETIRDMTDFAGMEDERPLSVHVALDLSGSMAVEHDAVRQSILQFVETLRLRGRDVRVGLLGYADEVVEQTPLSNDPTRFVNSMSRLTPTAMGIAEDGVGALVTAARALSRERGERVVVLLSDERLQTNALGASAFNPRSECSRYFEATNCFGRCTTQGCQAACWNRLGAEASRRMSRCRAHFGRACLAAGLGQLYAGSVTCSDVGAVMDPLVQRLASNSLRPFFVVSSSDGSDAALAHYGTLAAQLGGELLEVPNDSPDPQSYSAALLGIAEQLSTQYEARVGRSALRSGATGTAAAPILLVRPAHEWHASTLAPDVIAVAHVGGAPDCPALVGMRRDGALVRAQPCGREWVDLNVRAAAPRFANWAGQRAAVVSTEGDVVVADATSTTRVRVAGSAAPTDIAYDKRGHLWALVPTAAGARVAALDGAGTVVMDWPLPHAAVAFLAMPMDEHNVVCVLGTDGSRSCRAPSEAAWTTSRVAGVDPANVASTTHADVGFPLTIVGTRDGRVLRSADRGASFTEVLGPSPVGQPRIALAPDGDVLCAGVGPDVLCSENDGADWVRIGGADESTHVAMPFFVGTHLYVAIGGDIRVAHRVVTRELPDAAALFDTAVDHPRRTAEPLLRAFAQVLTADAGLSARIEGHADMRGNAADNEDLAARRAHSVANRLRSLGVRSQRMDVRSYGSRRPVRTGQSAADHARNRRVELVAMAPLPEGGWYGSRCEDP
jgi:hypothetical protein